MCNQCSYVDLYLPETSNKKMFESVILIKHDLFLALFRCADANRAGQHGIQVSASSHKDVLLKVWGITAVVLSPASDCISWRPKPSRTWGRFQTASVSCRVTWILLRGRWRFFTLQSNIKAQSHVTLCPYPIVLHLHAYVSQLLLRCRVTYKLM